MALVVAVLFDIWLFISWMRFDECSYSCLYFLNDGAVFRFDEGDACEVSEERPFSHDIFVFESHIFFYKVEQESITIEITYWLRRLSN